MFIEYRKEMKILFDNIAQLVHWITFSSSGFCILVDFTTGNISSILLRKYMIYCRWLNCLDVYFRILTWCWFQFIIFWTQPLGKCKNSSVCKVLGGLRCAAKPQPPPPPFQPTQKTFEILRLVKYLDSSLLLVFIFTIANVLARTLVCGFNVPDIIHNAM